MPYNSTLTYSNPSPYNFDGGWFLGDIPVISGWLGSTQVYPPQASEEPKPSDGLYRSEAGWNRGIHLTSEPLLNQVGITTDVMEDIDTIYFSRAKASYGDFTEESIRPGEWFLLSNNDARYYGEFTGVTSSDLDVVVAGCVPIEIVGQFVTGNSDDVLLGYFAQFRAPGDDRIMIEEV
jgi:hypothetical protein